jgi:hypothetical protein
MLHMSGMPHYPLGLLLTALIAAAGCGSGATPPPFKPVADNKLLMNSIIDPNADILWDSVKSIMTLAGTEEIRPRSEDEWTILRNSAVALAESGNLLMMVPRAKDGDQWMKAAQALIDTSEAAMKAIDGRNADQLFTAGGDIYNACSNCHAKYLDAIVNANTN